MLFTRRNVHLHQHAGQISFPGGGVEDSDADSVAAALRETDEETGIAPALVEPFGYLDCLDTVSGYCVTPVAGFVRGRLFDTPANGGGRRGVRGAARVHPRTRKPAPRTDLWRGREREIFALEWQGRRIWGATAAILKNLLDRLECTA